MEQQVRLELLKQVLAVWPEPANPANPAEATRLGDDLLKLQGITA